ncbi:MAG: TVP38/TMEM64 family protein [Gammaproteobacteria bacterium]
MHSRQSLWVRIAVLAAVGWVAVRLGLVPWLQLDRIQAEIGYFQELVRQHEMLALLILGGLYFLTTALSLPFGLFLSVLLGYLLGRWVGTSLIVCSATAGALVLFILARWFLGRWIRNRLERQPQAAFIARGFEHHAFNYLLLLRLIPLFPFWLVNLVPALTAIRTRDYVAATFLGILPGSFVFANFGASLRHFKLGDPWSTETVTALMLIILLSLLPVIYRLWKKKRPGIGPEVPG